MRVWIRRLLWGLVLLVALAVLSWLLMPEPIPVDVAVVERGPLQVTVDEEGRTRVRDRYVVSAPLTGRLRRLDLDAGDTVEAGQSLARMDPPPPELLDERTRMEAEARVEAAQAAVERATAQIQRVAADLEFARHEYERVRRLVAADVAADRDLRLAEREYRVQQRQMEMTQHERRVAEFERAQARAVLAVSATDAPSETEPLSIRAPVAGRVLRVFQESEAFVSAGMPLLELGDPRRLEVVVDLLSEDAAQVDPGASAHLERWGGPATLQGRVRLVEPSGFTDISALGVEEQRVNVIVDFVDPPEAYARLGDAFRVDARIVTWEADDVLRVPTGALFREGGRWMVFVVEDGRAVQRPVAVGRQTPMHAQVLDGLVDGDSVVLYPGDRVADSVRVTVRGERAHRDGAGAGLESTESSAP